MLDRFAVAFAMWLTLIWYVPPLSEVRLRVMPALSRSRFWCRGAQLTTMSTSVRAKGT